jgi:hypothetical protein
VDHSGLPLRTAFVPVQRMIGLPMEPSPPEPLPADHLRAPEQEPVAPASPTQPEPPPVPVPLNFTGYCLNCSYNLRGLSEARCPECGRRFRPGAPSTYSLKPRSQSAALKQLAEAARGKGRSHLPWTMSERVLWLEGRVRQLAAENAELEWTVRTLVDLLVARGILGTGELQRLMQAGVTSPVPYEEESDEPPEALPAQPAETPLSEEPDLEAAALRELQRAARQRELEQGEQSGAANP